MKKNKKEISNKLIELLFEYSNILNTIIEHQRIAGVNVSEQIHNSYNTAAFTYKKAKAWKLRKKILKFHPYVFLFFLRLEITPKTF